MTISVGSEKRWGVVIFCARRITLPLTKTRGGISSRGQASERHFYQVHLSLTLRPTQKRFFGLRWSQVFQYWKLNELIGDYAVHIRHCTAVWGEWFTK